MNKFALGPIRFTLLRVVTLNSPDRQELMMKRRDFMVSGLALAGVNSTIWGTPGAGTRAWLELRLFHLRNDLERSRLDKFLAEGFLPAFKKLGRSPLGFFNVSMGAQMPMMVVLTSYLSLGEMESILEKLSQDPTWNRALDELDGPQPMAYTRTESCLLRAFATLPAIVVPPQEPDAQPHVFELRTYESRNMRASDTKVRMFDEGEIDIFRSCGMLPVFFGQTLVGCGQPSLTYMLAYESMEAREKVWQRFANHPDWLKLRVKPGFADSEIVSSISSCYLRPTSYSEIR